jgi:lysozyme family protein
MSNFDIAIKTILNHEGRYVNDPQDPGGATNFGISLRFLKATGDLELGDLDHDGDIDSNDIKAMSINQAIELYKKYWWDKYNYEKIINQVLAIKLFDLAVNMGQKQAVICLQRAIRALHGTPLIEDGILGPKTIYNVNLLNTQALLSSLKSEAAGFYRSLNKPKYINGWLNRAYS